MSIASTQSPKPTRTGLEDWRAIRSLIAAHAPPSEIAASLVRLGLPSLAAEIAGGPPAIDPDDRINASTWATQADETALLMVTCGVLDRTTAAEARDALQTDHQFRAADATRVWRAADGTLCGLVGSLTEIAAMASPVPSEEDEAFPPPSVLLGINPPAMFERLWQDSAPRSNGYAPRILVCEPDATSALAGLTDLTMRLGLDRVGTMLRSDRVAWFVGNDGIDRLCAWMATSLDKALPKRLHLTPSPRLHLQEAAKQIAASLERAHLAQREALTHLDRDRPVWQPSSWDARPSRVQILTSRYTTYVRHSAVDLSEELRSLGINARVLEEPDNCTHVNPLFFARAIDAFRPDLVVCINYLRPHTGGAVPNQVPIISWIQDAMPHLMNGDQSWRAGSNDFAAGFIYPSLRDVFGFTSQQTLHWTNSVSTAKFHTGPLADNTDQLRCDLAMTTRHSEPPRAYFERSVRGLGVNSPAGRAAQLIGAGIGPVLEIAAEPWRYLNRELAQLTTRALQDASGTEPGREAVSVLHANFTLPLADLIFRQQTATWAASIADRRGWRLHLYGRGWSDHPTLGRFGRPELEHGEQLRAAYQLATVQLHAGVRDPMHQRLAEISFSGGVPLVRRTFEDMDRSRRLLLNDMHGNATPDLSMVKGGHPAYWIANHPEAMRLASEWGDLGCTLSPYGFIGNSPGEISQIESTPAGQLLGLKNDPNRVLVDLTETTFSSEAELESRVEAMMDHRRRDRLSAAVARRCKDRFGLQLFATKLLDLARNRAR